MIANLDELRAYTEERATRVPTLAPRVVLRSPGLTAEEGRQLKVALPGLPDSYLDCAQRFALGSVELGFVALGPRIPRDARLGDQLAIANGPANPVLEFLQKHHLYQVGVVESDPIAVTRDDVPNARAGEVVWVDIESSDDFAVTPLASNFVTFMVMAGRLWQAAHLRVGADQVLAGARLGPTHAEGWRRLASMTLDP